MCFPQHHWGLNWADLEAGDSAEMGLCGAEKELPVLAGQSALWFDGSQWTQSLNLIVSQFPYL